MRCGVERQQRWWHNRHGWSHKQVWWLKIGRDMLEVNDSSPRPECTAQGSTAGKINPHNFWLYKPVGLGVAEETAGFSGNFA